MKTRFVGELKYILVIAVMGLALSLKAQEVRLCMPSSHSSGLTFACFSPDGRKVLTTSDDHTARIWDVATGKMFHKLSGHNDVVTRGDFSPDGQKVLTVGWEGQVRVWNVRTGVEIFATDSLGSIINNAAFDPSGSGDFFFACESAAYLCDGTTGKTRFQLEGHRAGILEAGYSPDGKFLLTMADDSTIILWNTSNGKLINTFSAGGFRPTHTGFCQDGDMVWATDWVGRHRLWDCKTGAFRYELDKGSIKMSNHDHPLIIHQLDSTCTMRNLADGNVLRTFKATHSDLSPDGHMIALSQKDHINIIGTHDFDTIASLSSNNKTPQSISFSPDGARLIVIINDSLEELWDVHSGTLLRNLDFHKSTYCDIDYSPGSNYMLTYSYETPARIWDLHYGVNLHTLGGHSTIVNEVHYSPDMKYIVSACSDNKARVWDAHEGRLCFSLMGHSDMVLDAQFSPDGKTIITSSLDKTVQLWDSGDGRKTGSVGDDEEGWPLFKIAPDSNAVLISFSDFVDYQNCLVLADLKNAAERKRNCLNADKIYAIEFSPDHKYFATASKDWTAGIWDADRLTPTHTLKGHEYRVNDVAFSPDSKHLATAGQDQNIMIWKVENGKREKAISTGAGFVNSIEYSPNGEYVVSANDSGTVVVWDVNTGKAAHTLTGHQDRVMTIGYSPDGKMLLSSSRDNTAILWDAVNFKQLFRLDAKSGMITSAHFSPDGSRVITSYDDGSFVIWKVSDGTMMVRIFGFDERSWVAITSDNYYYGSKDACKYLYWIINNDKIFTFEQFDLQYNRPDIVLQRIGVTDTNLINAYKRAYFKRLKKMHFEESMFSPDFHMPSLEIQNGASLPLTTGESTVTLQISAKDSLFRLDRLNIWVNDVPLYGSTGIDLRSDESHSVVKNVPVTLSRGVNRIQVSVLNEKGVESTKESLWITSEPKLSAPSCLYFIGLGVSHYRDPNFDLSYAVKDGRDMAASFSGIVKDSSSGKTTEPFIDKVIIDTLFNESVTRGNIMALRQKLMSTSVNDRVVIFIAGHGLLDTNNDFYYATWDMDFADPAKRGVLYEDLESLLDGIPARKKLLLMDACHSGELDKEAPLNKDRKSVV